MDHIEWKYSCGGQNGWNNGGNMIYDYGLDHGELGEHFLVLTYYSLMCEYKRSSYGWYTS